MSHRGARSLRRGAHRPTSSGEYDDDDDGVGGEAIMGEKKMDTPTTNTNTTTKQQRRDEPSPPPPPKKKKAKSSVLLPYEKMKSLSHVNKDRLDPKQRGVHRDAVQVGIAPTSASTCVDCGRIISKGSTRWGLKYAGNPLSLPVLPLYGTYQPMIMWCHGPDAQSSSSRKLLCGLAFVRILPHHRDPSSPHWLCDAARTCHLCSDAPDNNNDNASLRVLCGGGPHDNGKIREHAFHINCWKLAMIEGARTSLGDDEPRRRILAEAVKHPESQWERRSSSRSWSYGDVLTYQQLTQEERAAVSRALDADDS